MKLFIVLSILIVSAYASSGPYKFSYEANDEGQHQRYEQGEHGNVKGSYSYIDSNGNLRKVDYVADKYGFRPSGDIGVDKETEAAAAELAAQAPQGNINFETPASSYENNYSKKGSYNSPRKQQQYPKPQQKYNQRSQQSSYYKPSSQKSYGGTSYIQQQQVDSYSFNAEINHTAPKPQPQQQQYRQASRIQKPAPRPSYNKPSEQIYQQQEQQQNEGSYNNEEDGSYKGSNDGNYNSGNDGNYNSADDFESNSNYEPKKTVEYEVRAPTHKIFAKYN